MLTELRIAALACRTSARMDLFKACALLSTTPAPDRNTIANALTRGLERALPRAPVFHRPGVAELSFDEAWLLRAATAACEDDAISLGFLLRSRICPAHRRNIGYLIGLFARPNRAV